MSEYPDPDTWLQLEVDATTPDGIEFYDEPTEIEQTMFVDLCIPDEEAPMF